MADEKEERTEIGGYLSGGGGMTILIIDPVGGISGDMLLGSLIHLGCPVEYLKGVLDTLPIDGFSLDASLRPVHGIDAVGLTFACADASEHRTFGIIRDTILSSLPGPVKDRAVAIFKALAEAEAQVHGVRADDVHFHEVGAMDSILDIVGISAALEYFAPDAVYSRTVPLGTGTTKSMHGTIPLPAPATIKLLEGRLVRFTDISSELATPTGAAVIAALARKDSPPADLIVRSVGYGCGKRQIPGWPNLCRTILCESLSAKPGLQVYLVAADVDDMLPEDTEAVMAKLYEAGARDAGLIQKIMKRGRPGFCIQAICMSEHLDDVLNCLLKHTSSIGVRYHPVERRVLERRIYRISTLLGDVNVKESILPDGSKRIKPEYRDLAEIAERNGITIAAVRAEVDKALAEGEGQGPRTDK